VYLTIIEGLVKVTMVAATGKKGDGAGGGGVLGMSR